MPRALPRPKREAIVQFRQPGLSYRQVAATTGVPAGTVRPIWRRFRDGGPAGLQLHYDRCGRCGRRFPEPLAHAALHLKREHPRWGAGLIRWQWAERFSAVPLPGERPLQQWFRAAGLQLPRATRPPQEPQRAQAVHAVWPRDAQEQLRLGDGSGVWGLTLTDAASGALLAAAPFPPVLLGPRLRRPSPTSPARLL
jgi:transposase